MCRVHSYYIGRLRITFSMFHIVEIAVIYHIVSILITITDRCFQICTKGVSKCPNPGALEMAMCKNDGQLAEKIQSGAKTEETLTGKSFALTKCRVPSISGCSNMLPSPDWLAAEREAYFNSSLDSYVDTLSDGNEECKTKLYSFLCAFPTCNTNQTAVIGYRTQASCEDAFAWYSTT